MVAVGLLLLATLARADSGVVNARASTVSIRLTGYARVESVALLELSASQTGVVTGLDLLPGDTVAAGHVLGRLTGPAVEQALARRRSAVTGAQAALTAAQRVLAIEEQSRKSRLATQKAVDQARAALAEARARLKDARSQLQAVQAAVVLKAPADGIVRAVHAADGEQIQAGQSILTLQPQHRLWLRAVYYGSDATAVTVGMTGRFEPADGGSAIAVKVRTVIGAVGPDGGEAAGLEATVAAPGWRYGQTGRVTLQGPRRSFVAVPTRALILDRGRWWVMVRTPEGERPRPVVPGPTRGESTLIEKGLAAGTAVVVENAYLEFHRNFSQQYSPPD